MRLQRDAKSVPEVRQCGRDHRPLHASSGIGTCSRYENNPTPNAVTTAASTKELFQVAVRSPSAETNTQAKVPGISPKKLPNKMKHSGPVRMQAQPSH